MAREPRNTRGKAQPSNQLVQGRRAKRAALPGEEVVAEFLGSFVPENWLRPTPTHPLVHQLNQTWFDGDHAVLAQLPHRNVHPMRYGRGHSILRGDDAAGVQSTEFPGAQATLEQHPEDGSDLFEGASAGRAHYPPRESFARPPRRGGANEHQE
jgi:hypothetical protein